MVLSVSAWRAGASDTWAIMVVRQLAVARVSTQQCSEPVLPGGPGRRGSEAEGLGGVLRLLGLGAAMGLERGRRASSWTWACLGPWVRSDTHSCPPGPGHQDSLPALG